jgi:hypothetical protein
MAILNSGTTSHFLTTNAPATNIVSTTKPIIAHLPNREQVHSSHTCTIDIPSLPPRARAAHIIPGLTTHSLLSVVSLCNTGCTIYFTKIGCTIIYHVHTIVCGQKCTRTGLWMIPLSKDTSPPPANFQPTIAMAANVDATSSAAEYAHYVHQLLCLLPAATLLLALDKSTKLQTIPGPTSLLICSHLPMSTATDKGHMRRQRSNTASTRNRHADIILAHAKVDHMFPAHEACAVQDMFFFALADATTGTMYSDLTGAFHVRSFKNMQYIFVVYIYDLNAIIVRPMPSQTDASFIAAFTEVFNILDPGSNPGAIRVPRPVHVTADASHIALRYCSAR